MSGDCVLCHTDLDDELNLGELKKLDDLYAHYYCLLLATTITQSGDDNEGILGFLEDDIIDEVSRCKLRECYYCEERGASIMCRKKSCKIMFHLPCGVKEGCSFQFHSEYLSTCHLHRRIQKFKIPESGGECPICFDLINFNDQVNTLRAPCCSRAAYFHKECIQRLALSAGYFFKCPLCNDNVSFQRYMRDYGVFIPERDASWEDDPDAYSDLYQRHNECNSKNCLCPQGRKYSARGIWYIVICNSCGSNGMHIFCNPLKNKHVWMCTVCRAAKANRRTVLRPLPGFSPDSESNLSDFSTASTSDSGNRRPSFLSTMISDPDFVCVSTFEQMDTVQTSSAAHPDVKIEPGLESKDNISAMVWQSTGQSSSNAACQIKSESSQITPNPGASLNNPTQPSAYSSLSQTIKSESGPSTSVARATSPAKSATSVPVKSATSVPAKLATCVLTHPVKPEPSSSNSVKPSTPCSRDERFNRTDHPVNSKSTSSTSSSPSAKKRKVNVRPQSDVILVLDSDDEEDIISILDLDTDTNNPRASTSATETKPRISEQFRTVRAQDGSLIPVHIIEESEIIEDETEGGEEDNFKKSKTITEKTRTVKTVKNDHNEIVYKKTETVISSTVHETVNGTNDMGIVISNVRSLKTKTSKRKETNYEVTSHNIPWGEDDGTSTPTPTSGSSSLNDNETNGENEKIYTIIIPARPLSNTRPSTSRESSSRQVEPINIPKKEKEDVIVID